MENQEPSIGDRHDGHVERDKETDVQDGDQNETGPVDGVIRYEVNGEALETDKRRLSLEEILRRAGAPAGVDVSQIDSYFLENTADGRRYENLADLIVLEDGDRFVAIHVGKTPVACHPTRS